MAFLGILTQKVRLEHVRRRELYYLIGLTYDLSNILGRRQQVGLRSKCTDKNDKVVRVFETLQLQLRMYTTVCEHRAINVT